MQKYAIRQNQTDKIDERRDLIDDQNGMSSSFMRGPGLIIGS